jgi:hypothetical protein
MDLCDIASPTLNWALLDHHRVAYAQAVVNDYGIPIDIQEGVLLKRHDKPWEDQSKKSVPTLPVAFIIR